MHRNWTLQLQQCSSQCLIGTATKTFLPGIPDGKAGEVRKVAATVELVAWEAELDSPPVVDCKNKFVILMPLNEIDLQWNCFRYKPNLRPHICVHVFCLTLLQMAWLGFFPYSHAANGNLTSVSLFAPLWGTLTQDALTNWDSAATTSFGETWIH